jgi:hypothetical protein
VHFPTCPACGVARTVAVVGDRSELCGRCAALRLWEPVGPWVEDAACASVDPELWYPDQGEGRADAYRAAVKICGTCPVQDPCLDYAMRVQELHGVWGGTTPKQRKIIFKEDTGGEVAG